MGWMPWLVVTTVLTFTQGTNMKPVGEIRILLMDDGTQQYKVQLPGGLQVALGVLAVAGIDLPRLFKEQKEPGIEIARSPLVH